MTFLYAVNIDEPISPKIYRDLLMSVSRKRREQAGRYRFAADQKRCVYAEAMLQFVIASRTKTSPRKIPYYYNEYGKPYITIPKNFYFNLSHSGQWVLCGAGEKELGVDVERIGDAGLELARKVFHPSEYAGVTAASGDAERQELFYTYWTLKESYIKYRGMGLSLPLDSFFFTLEKGVIRLHSDDKKTPNCYIRRLDAFHKAAVCTLDNDVGQIQVLSLQQIHGALRRAGLTCPAQALRQ